MAREDKQATTACVSLTGVAKDDDPRNNLVVNPSTCLLPYLLPQPVAARMASQLARFARLQHATRHSSLPFLYPCCSTSTVPVRRAMMSAVRTGPDHPPQPTLAESPPAAIPSAATLSPDAASPQVAAAPPPAPKVAEKPRSRIRSTKVALTIVCPRLCILC